MFETREQVRYLAESGRYSTPNGLETMNEANE